MEKLITKYQVTRISKSLSKRLTTNAVRRSYTYFDNLDEAVEWAKRHSTKDNIECKVFAFDCYWEPEINDYMWTTAGRDTERDYEAVFEKRGECIFADHTVECKEELEREKEEAASKINDEAIDEKHEAFKMFVPQETKFEDLDDPKFIDECGGIQKVKEHLLFGIRSYIQLKYGNKIGMSFCYSPEFVDIWDFRDRHVRFDRIHTGGMKPSKFEKKVWDFAQHYLRSTRRNVAC